MLAILFGFSFSFQSIIHSLIPSLCQTFTLISIYLLILLFRKTVLVYLLGIGHV